MSNWAGSSPIARNGRNSADFALKLDWRKCSALPRRRDFGLFSLKAHWQSGFNDSAGRTQGDHKPMMRRSPGVTFLFTLLIFISGRIHRARVRDDRECYDGITRQSSCCLLAAKAL